MTERDIFADAFSDQEPVAEAETPAPEQPAPEPAPEPTPEPLPEAPQAEPEAPQAPEARPEAQPAHVPLTAMLDEREKRQRLEQEVERLRAAQRPAEAPEVPDPYSDVEGYQAFMQAQIQQSQWAAVTSISQTMAAKEYGADKVKEATDAFMAEVAQKPWLQAELRSQSHPYEYVVQRHQQQQVLSKVTPDEIAQFQAWKAAQAGLAPAPLAPGNPAAPPHSPPKATPPPSLAAAPSAGGISTVGDEDAFSAEFKKKA